jgi:hypothetical protein
MESGFGAKIRSASAIPMRGQEDILAVSHSRRRTSLVPATRSAEGSTCAACSALSRQNEAASALSGIGIAGATTVASAIRLPPPSRFPGFSR